jgi:hypothetical protein
MWDVCLELSNMLTKSSYIISNNTKKLTDEIKEGCDDGGAPADKGDKRGWQICGKVWTSHQPPFNIFSISISENSQHTGVIEGYWFVLEYRMSG